MAHWEKREFKLPRNHGWRAKPGYNVFVADKGAVRLDYPQGWITKPGKVSVSFHDLEPPDDNCVLEVSFLRLPPIDWSGLSLVKLVQDLVERDERGVTAQGEVLRLLRGDLELAWTEHRFTDKTEGREAVARTCLARGQGIQALITFAFWPEDSVRCAEVWDEVLRSLQLGMWVKDPTGRRLS